MRRRLSSTSASRAAPCPLSRWKAQRIGAHTECISVSCDPVEDQSFLVDGEPCTFAASHCCVAAGQIHAPLLTKYAVRNNLTTPHCKTSGRKIKPKENPMPRTNRHFLPGHVWHITHRCHQKQFLLKFPRDRRRYVHRVFEAKKRFGLCVA
jgi:hypothetical protein